MPEFQRTAVQRVTLCADTGAEADAKLADLLAASAQLLSAVGITVHPQPVSHLDGLESDDPIEQQAWRLLESLGLIEKLIAWADQRTAAALTAAGKTG